MIDSAVTSRRLIVTSYNLVIIRFLYQATNNRDSVFTVTLDLDRDLVIIL